MSTGTSRATLVVLVIIVLILPMLLRNSVTVEQVSIPSRADWSSGPSLEIPPGTIFSIEVAATERWSSGSWTGTADGSIRQWGGYALPGAAAYSLIGRFGPDGAPFFIGSRYEGTAPPGGPLMLAMNDVPGEYWDNRGELTAVVTIP